MKIRSSRALLVGWGPRVTHWAVDAQKRNNVWELGGSAHLMFIALQSHASGVLTTRVPSKTSCKFCKEQGVCVCVCVCVCAYTNKHMV